jgi:hypothetical protein
VSDYGSWVRDCILRTREVQSKTQIGVLKREAGAVMAAADVWKVQVATNFGVLFQFSFHTVTRPASF